MQLLRINWPKGKIEPAAVLTTINFITTVGALFFSSEIPITSEPAWILSILSLLAIGPLITWSILNDHFSKYTNWASALLSAWTVATVMHIITIIVMYIL